MSSAHDSEVHDVSPPPPPPGAVPVYQVRAPGEKPEKKIDYITVYGHSNLLYWWPVWLVSFVLAGVTYAEGNQMAVVPPGTVIEHGATVPGKPGTHDVLVVPEDKTIKLGTEQGQRDAVGMTVSSNNNLGVIFVATLVLVALASTILLRGLVSLVAVVGLITLTVTFALFGWWNSILHFVGDLDIRMNAAGYLTVALPLFLAWLAVVLVYDRQQYIVFDQGQIRYVREIGDSEIVMQSEGAIVEKKRNDVFRHWLLGFGTGDLLVRTGGPNGPTIELENVLNIGSKLVLIDKMIKEKAITVDG